MMLQKFKGWLGKESGTANAVPAISNPAPAGLLKELSSEGKGGHELEPFGRLLVPRARGMEILGATPARRNWHREIRDRLSTLSPLQKTELVDRVLARLALLVFDLPASERRHHTGRFGLLDHTLDVAARTARELSGGAFEISPDPALAHREGPLWAYAGVVLALVHDLGKMLDLDVLAPGSSERWDPFQEPLERFAERHDLGETGPALYHYHPGRGMGGHEQATERVLPLLLHSGVEAYLGPRLGSMLAAFGACEPFSRAEGLSGPAKAVVAVVRRMDPLSTWEGRKAMGPGEALAGLPTLPVKSALSAERVPAAASSAIPLADCKPGPVLCSTLEAVRGLAGPETGGAGEPGAPGVLADAQDLLPFKKGPKGDPVERERRLATALHPPRFVRLLAQMISAHRLSRNGLYSECYLSPEFTYLVLPGALKRVALINRLPWDGSVEGRMLGALRGHPQVVPQDEETLPVALCTRPGGGMVRALRLRTPGFLPESVLLELGVHSYELRALGEGAPVLERSGSAG